MFVLRSLSFVLTVCSLYVAPSLARSNHLSRSDSLAVPRHNLPPPTYANESLVLGDDPAQLQRRDGTKYVFMHHIVGNTYDYTSALWSLDIQEIRAKGVDAIALNIGPDTWQATQIASAFAAAKGTDMKLFFSFDFASGYPSSVSSVVALVNSYASDSNQFLVNGKPMISSYEGGTLSASDWASIKSQTGGYLMPFISGLEGNFGSWSTLDSWYCWGCAWPNGNTDKTTADDYYYMDQLAQGGIQYATTISGWMFTHYSYKNFYQRGDNWLINNRWEELISMRSSLTHVEMVTWNDYGESDYFGPLGRSDAPTGTTWADGFPHTAWFDMSEYYITAFKTGSYPTVTKDVIYFWARPHPASASCPNDPVGTVSGGSWASDYLWAAVFATSSGSVTLTSGSNSQTFSVSTGVNKLQLSLSSGRISVSMSRNGAVLFSATPTDFTYTTSPTLYNYNAYVGSASSTTSATSTTATSASTSTATTTTSSSTSSSAATSTSTSTSYTYVGCYADSDTRVLSTQLISGSSSLTTESCMATCTAAGYAYSGAEYGSECWCGNSVSSTASTSSGCTYSCSGNSNELCGGNWAISVYHAGSSTSTATTSAATATSTSSSLTHIGCYTDSDTRVLSTNIFSDSSSLTIESCASACTSAGWTYSGVEYGQQCWCGASISSSASASTGCTYTCPGNSNELCGGNWAIDVYRVGTSSGSTTTATTTSAAAATSTTSSSSYTYVGCYTDGDTRVLSTQLISGSSSLTTETCMATCVSAGYSYGGTEYGSECWCGNSVSSSASTSTGCTYSCAGNSNELCGGNWAIDVYHAGTSSSSTTTATTTSAAAATSAASSSSSYTYVGCYTDGDTRVLSTNLISGSSSLTTETCMATCASAGYSYGGTEYGDECWCGKSISSTASSGSGCTMTCNGNANEICGGNWQISVYQLGTSSSTVSVTFTETASTSSGENVYLVGSISQLGSWAPASAIAMTSSSGTWSTTVSLPPSTTFEYKFIRKESDGSIVWESDPNRSATTSSSGSQTISGSWR